MGELHVDSQFASEHSNLLCGRRYIAGDDLRSAVREDCAGNALLFAPLQLNSNGCVPNERAIALAH